MWYPMICHLNYTIDKSHYKKYFFDNYDKGDWHRKGDKVFCGLIQLNILFYVLFNAIYR